MGRLGRKKKRARGARWEGGREKSFPLPIVPNFHILAILILKYPPYSELSKQIFCYE